MFTHVVAAEAVDYVGSPAQAKPPDGKFKTGERVAVVLDAGSYCKVRSEGGVEAYVVWDSLKKIE